MPCQLWDISPAIDASAPVFPGDTVYSQRPHFTIGPGCPVNVHAITLSPHTGAHADAPLHYTPDGPAAGMLDLEPFLGPCRVIHCIGCGPLVEPADIRHALHALPPRVLVRTRTHATQAWDHFSAYAPATLELLARCGVRLVGIDTPSVDPGDSSTLAAHHTLLQHDMRVLENLVLDAVPAGDYELIALPLKLMQSDASPVRAVLRALA